MNLLNIKTEVSRIPLESELTLIKMGIIFSQKMTSVGFNLRLLNAYKNFDALKDKQIINIYDSIEWPENGPTTKEQMHDFYKSLMQLRNLKHKNQQGYAQLATFEKHMKVIRQELYHNLTTINVNNNMDALPLFLEDGILEIIEYDSESAKETIEDLIIRYLTTTDLIPYFDETIYFKPAGEYAKQYEKEMNEKVKMGTSLMQDLFNFPALNSLSANQLRIIRNEFQEKLQPVYSGIEIIRKEIEDIVFNEENMDRLSNILTDNTFKYASILDPLADENIYFMQIKNSTKDVIYRTFYLGITSIKQVVNYYARRDIITREGENYILENIARVKDIESSCIFFSNELVDKPAEANKVDSID